MEFSIETVMLAKPWRGKIVEGIVDYVTDHYAFLKIDSLPISDRAYLHVSQFTDKKVESFKDIISAGDSLSVLVLRFNRKKEGWDVSHRLGEIKNNISEDFEIGSITKAKIIRSNPEKILLEIAGYPASIGFQESKLLYKTGILSEGSLIDVKITGFDSKFFGFTCTRSAAIEFTEGTILTIRVVELIYESKTDKDGHKAEWMLNGCTDQGILVSVKLDCMANPEKRISFGDLCQIEILGKGKKEKWLHWGKLILPYPDDSIYTIKPGLGERRTGTIKTVIGYGAFVCIWDGRDDLIHISKIINDEKPNLYDHLEAGEEVEVEVCESTFQDKPYELNFVRLLDDRKNSESPHESIFDLSSVRNKYSGVGGFARSTKFKKDTLDIFEHICVVCGNKQTVGSDFTAAEAAHIVPRGKRGTDHIGNAMCLCKSHHWAFDRGIIGISSDQRVLVTEIIKSGESDLSASLISLENSKIYWPSSLKFPEEAFLWHLRNVFLAWDEN